MRKRSKLINLLLILAGWFAFGVLLDSYAILNYSNGDWVSIRTILTWEMMAWFLWAILSYPIFKITERFPVQHGSILSNLSIHLILGPIFATLHAAANLFGVWMIGVLREKEVETLMQLYQEELFIRIPWRFVVYLLIVMGCHVLIFQRRFALERENSAQLKARAAKAELEMLKMQFHPHFLFNTMNTISELIHRERDAAEEMLVSLGEFFRRTLKLSGAQEITLAEEMDFLDTYLSIQNGRFEDQLIVEKKIDDRALRAKVPGLILQPLVENAIKHGIGASTERCKIEVSARVDHSNLILRVCNDINRNHTDRTSGLGMGLANTRERLQILYGNSHEFSVNEHSEKEFVVTVQIPARFSEGETFESNHS
jgi:two-component sensor histidine kinase